MVLTRHGKTQWLCSARLVELKTATWISAHKASTVTLSKEKALEKHETSLDVNVEEKEAHSCSCSRATCSLVLKAHLTFPLNYRARSSSSREY